MSERPDFERVLAEHRVWEDGEYVLHCECGSKFYPDQQDARATHLAAALNAEVARWLADERTRERVADAFSHTGVNRPQGFTVPEWRTELATEALAALAPTDTTADEKGAGR